MTAVIHLQNLSKSFGNHEALQACDLRVEKGTIYGFLGENGAGKTTTIKLMVGLLKPSTGQIHLFGESLQGHQHALMKRVGALIEAPSYYRHLSGYDNMLILAKLRGLNPAWILKALGTVGLTEVAKAKVKTYSHGMCQRLGIAMAILGEPELVILDEPTNGLDPEGIRDMRYLIQSLPKQFGTTVFISSHLLAEVEQLAHQVGILKQGRLLFDGDLGALRAQARPSIILRTSQIARAVAVLRDYPTLIDEDRQIIEVEAPPTKIAAITQSLVTAAIPILEIKEHQPNLEELYFQLTQAAS